MMQKGLANHSSSAHLTTGEFGRIVLVGNYPPRRCGIATFTADVRTALIKAGGGAHVDVVAMVDPGAAYAFPKEVVLAIDQNERAAYRAAARRINAHEPEIVCLQHEFGIFGGPAGAHLLDLIDELRAPLVTTLHTVLTDPTADQRRVLLGLARRSSRLIVMARRGVGILRRVYDVPAEKIAFAPHGAPDLPFSEPAAFKQELGYGDAEMILTFGLLSPGKGIEYMIDALPRIAEARPRVRYVVLGATHPRLAGRQGENYRERLAALAEELGVRDRVEFVDKYADTQTLLRYLSAADVYVTPYLNKAQITSGTLSYAVAMGKPVISTPYWHAEELLADGCGLIAPFRDAEALADAAIRLLSDPALNESVRRKAYAAGRAMVWSRVAERYFEIFRSAASMNDNVVTLRRERQDGLPTPSLQGLQRITDDCGVLQHSAYGVPDRNHGYCLDDNARALMLTSALAETGHANGSLERLAWTYAAFVHSAWNEERGGFRNFMSYDRRWLEDEGSEDSAGRGFWAVAATAENGLDPQLRRWAADFARRIAPHVAKLRSPRARAFSLLGACALVRIEPGGATHALALELAEGLRSQLDEYSGEGWRWFEEVLAYDNARLPQALIVAGRTLGRRALIDAGVDALAWLCDMQTGKDGAFRPVGTESFGARRKTPQAFDQQPLEAAAMIDACEAAYACRRDRKWLKQAQRAFDWYLGANDLCLAVAEPENGLCFDGLTRDNVNFNQGAESVLSFQLAICAMTRLRKTADAKSDAHQAAIQSGSEARSDGETFALADKTLR